MSSVSSLAMNPGDLNRMNGEVFGSGSNSGMFGLGQYRTDPYQANMRAFQPDSNERAYIKQLQNLAAGKGQSAAQIQMQQGLNQATQQSQALANSQRGISPALAARYAAQSQAGMQQNVAANSAMLRAQEQQGYMNALGNELQSVRTGRMGYENLNSGNQNYASGLNLQGYSSAAANRGNFMSHMGNMFSGAGMMAEGGMVDPASMNKTPGLPQLSAPAAWADAKGGSGGEKKDPTKKAAPWEQGGGVDYEGAASGLMMAAEGGEVGDGSNMNPGGMNATPSLAQTSQAGWSDGGGGGEGGGGIMKMLPMLAMLNQGGSVPDPNGPQSHTGMFLSQALNSGGSVQPMNYQNGGQLPGRAKVAGDSLQNDFVPILGSPGEIMLPRSVTMSDNPGDKAKAFVEKVKASYKKGK